VIATSPRRAIVAASTLLSLGLTAPACDNPSAPGPSIVTLQITYTQPAPDTMPPPGPDAATCAHHYAPVNLMLETSWGEASRLQQLNGLVYGLSSGGVTTGQDHWLTFVDIALCPAGNVRVTQDVTVNTVALTRIIDRNGVPTLGFRVDSSGRVVP